MRASSFWLATKYMTMSYSWGFLSEGRDPKFGRVSPEMSRKLPKYIRQLNTIQAK